MLRLNRFQYVAPHSLQHAVTLLEEHGPDAMLMAGGTDLLPNIKHRLFTPSLVIGLRNLPELHGISAGEDGWLSIGAGTSLHDLECHPAIAAPYPALTEAVRLIPTPQVRAAGTIGGNVCLDTRCNYYNQSYDWRKAIGFCMKKDSPVCRVAPGGDRCWAVASADTVPVLVALHAEATIVGPTGTRRAPIESLYHDDGLKPLTLTFGEIIAQIHLPPVDQYVTVYEKFRIRGSFDFPLVGIAAAIRVGADGLVDDARIAMTAVASYPERALPAENMLRGKPLTPETIAAAGNAIFRLAKPMDNTAGTVFHRKRMARVLLERALRQVSRLDAEIRESA